MKVSRSLGDVLAHNIGVTSEPHVVVHDLKRTDKFMTMATRNVWKELTVEMVGDVLHEYFGKHDYNSTTNMLFGKLKD